MNAARYILEVSRDGGAIVDRFPVLLCRNTHPDSRIWRLNVFNAQCTGLLVPHQTFDEPIEPADILWNLEVQSHYHHQLQGALRLLPYHEHSSTT